MEISAENHSSFSRELNILCWAVNLHLLPFPALSQSFWKEDQYMCERLRRFFISISIAMSLTQLLWGSVGSAVKRLAHQPGEVQ